MTHARPRVLIVEDDPDTLLLLRVNLEASGFGTSLAADGGTAIRRIVGEHPDLVLLDLMLPGLDGWGVLAEVGDDDASPPIVVCSAKDAPQERLRASRMGASSYITKPFDLRDVIETITRVLERFPAPAEPPVDQPT